MKTYKITIEETVCETFEIEANSREDAYEKAVQSYRNCEIVLEPGECVHRQMSIPNELTGDLEEWREF